MFNVKLIVIESIMESAIKNFEEFFEKVNDEGVTDADIRSFILKSNMLNKMLTSSSDPSPITQEEYDEVMALAKKVDEYSKMADEHLRILQE